MLSFLKNPIICFLISCTLPAWGQEGELPEEVQVVIKNNKNIVLPEVQKPAEKVLLTLKPLPKIAQKYSYKDFTVTLPLLDPKLKPPVLRNEPVPEVRNGYIRLAGGNLGSTLLDAWYNSGREKDYAYGAYIRHNASARGPVENSGFSQNTLGAYGKYFTSGFNLSGGLDYNRSRYNFYGYDQEADKDRSEDEVKQIFQSILFRLDLEKAKRSKHFNYQGGLTVGNFSDRFKASESEIGLNFNGTYSIKDSSFVRILTDVSILKREDSTTQNRTLWRLQPTYHFGYKGFQVEAGFQASFDSEPELKDGAYQNATRFHFHPQLHIQQKIFENMLIGYTGIAGGITKRTLRTSTEINPFLAPMVYLRHENQLLNFYLGLKGQWTGKLQYHTQLSFETLSNQAFQVSDSLAREKYNLVYDNNNTRRFTWETEALYDFSVKTRAGLRFSLLSYGVKSLPEPWHAPHTLFTVFARQYLSDEILLSSEFYYMGGLKAFNPETAETEKLKGMADLNLKGEYFFKKRFSAFVSAHNILNNKNQRFLFYPTQGFRIMVGLSATL